MKDRPEASPFPIIEELKAKQRNTLWPDTLINSSSVDGFLWKGSPNPPLVQRIGAWIFGITFMMCGLGTFEIVREKADDEIPLIPIGVGCAFFLVGMRVFRNGFRRKAKDPSQAKDSDQELRP